MIIQFVFHLIFSDCPFFCFKDALLGNLIFRELRDVKKTLLKLSFSAAAAVYVSPGGSLRGFSLRVHPVVFAVWLWHNRTAKNPFLLQDLTPYCIYTILY